MRKLLLSLAILLVSATVAAAEAASKLTTEEFMIEAADPGVQLAPVRSRPSR